MISNLVEKAAPINLDNLDKDIIRLLQESPQRTNSNIAEITNVSESTVKNRISRLEKNGILKTYAVLNPTKFGYKGRFSVGIQVAPGRRHSIVKQLQNIKEIVFIGHTIGRFDVIVDIRLKDPEQLLELIIDIVKGIPGITSTESLYLLDIKRDYYDWKLPGGVLENKSSGSTGLVSNWTDKKEVHSEIQIDETDYKIISMLQKNGRITNAEIARTINVSKPTIRNRLDRLINNHVLKIVAVLNPKAAGYKIDVYIDIKVAPLDLETVCEALLDRNEVVYLAYLSGSYDIVIELLLKSNDDLFSFVLDVLEQIPGVTRYEILHLVKTEMMEYEWKIPNDILNGKS